LPRKKPKLKLNILEKKGKNTNNKYIIFLRRIWMIISRCNKNINILQR
jgi:hypothetical protein